MYLQGFIDEDSFVEGLRLNRRLLVGVIAVDSLRWGKVTEEGQFIAVTLACVAGCIDSSETSVYIIIIDRLALGARI